MLEAGEIKELTSLKIRNESSINSNKVIIKEISKLKIRQDLLENKVTELEGQIQKYKEHKCTNNNTQKEKPQTEKTKQQYECDKCDYNTYNIISLRQHQEIKHIMENYECNNCEYKTLNIVKLRQHSEIEHNKINPINLTGSQKDNAPDPFAWNTVIIAKPKKAKRPELTESMKYRTENNQRKIKEIILEKH